MEGRKCRLKHSARAIQRFWHKYLPSLKNPLFPRARAILSKSDESVHEGEFGGRRLVAHGPDDIGRYLADKGRQANLQKWKSRQIVDALRILYRCHSPSGLGSTLRLVTLGGRFCTDAVLNEINVNVVPQQLSDPSALSTEPNM